MSIRRAVRRRVLAASLGVVLTAGTVLLAAMSDSELGDRSGVSRRVPPRPDPTLGERLIPHLDLIVTKPREHPADAELDIPFFEVLSDGRVADVRWNLPDHTAVSQLRAMSDGSVLVHGTRDLQPGRARSDGPYVEGVAFPLLRIAADGTIESEKDTRVPGEYVTLIGAEANDAILFRYTPARSGPVSPRRIVARDLTTGAERTPSSRSTSSPRPTRSRSRPGPNAVSLRGR
jgi:hypothetical protein